ncbi:ABC transporter ATP-binding protein [Hymenobacter taeanensis]|uniref:ABC transporter ATP-binding protein n=1 Tax=Hymenobacter taeanensis TaxID=2735321 RepID=A0A6M6BHI1_9BACT|nr:MULTISPECIES: ABC transporter ATP-binding protein [Hymenobacter]QJX47556.1 ABC transporter ATP-binding protein [Hymenobacter taeanensis]UOQ82960.1 ABC transporter ATP-binding protein/permease [Hymenobacter sp. 5414T-23]
MSVADKRKAVGQFFLLIIASLLDVFGLASLIPVIMAASRPGSIFENKYSSYVYHALSFQSERNFLVFLILAVFAFFLFKNLFTVFVNYQQVRFTAHLALNIVTHQVNKHNNIPFWEYMRIGSGHLINDTVSVPQIYVNNIIRQLFAFFSELIIILVIVGGILIYQPSLFLILVIVLVPSALMTYRFLRDRSTRIGDEINAVRPQSFNVLHDLFHGFIELRLANKQEKFKNKLLVNEAKIQELEAKSNLYNQLPLKVIEMVAILAVVTIFLYSLFFADSPENLVTIIGLFAAAAYRLMPSANRLILSLVSFKQFKFTYETINKFSEYSIYQVPKQIDVSFSDMIVINNVSFSFPESPAPVLQNIYMQVKKGEKVGIIGASGSGKTTLMNILLRFYIEQEGFISVDGKKLTEANLQSWYKQIGYVKQDTFLMEASIQDNITLSDDQVDYDRLEYAIEQASLTEFINSLDDGIKTNIGERGSRLSGGQRQRIGIARALYKKTELLVMDEATSALDSETEREVNEAISRLSSTDITMFIIAHRITTLRDCTRIYELRDGKVIAEHQYDELIQKQLS